MCDEVFYFSSRYLLLVDSSCKLPHLVAVFPSNLLYSDFFTVELTLVLALLFAMDPTFQVHLNFHLLRYLRNSQMECIHELSQKGAVDTPFLEAYVSFNNL